MADMKSGTGASKGFGPASMGTEVPRSFPSVELSPWSHESIAPTPIHAQILAACARSEEVGLCPSHTMPAAGLRSHLSSKQEDLHVQVRQTTAADRDAQNSVCARVCACVCVSQAEAGFRLCLACFNGPQTTETKLLRLSFWRAFKFRVGPNSTRG